MIIAEAYELALAAVTDLWRSGIPTQIKPPRGKDDERLVATYGDRPDRMPPSAWLNIQFFPKSAEQREAIWEKQKQLGRQGILFDTGGGIGGGRDWEIDWSLRCGEYNVEQGMFVEESIRAMHLVNAMDANTWDRGVVRPTIVCLCGSTRFIDAFRSANLKETLAGNIVLSYWLETKSDADLLAAGDLTPDFKEGLVQLHKRKIDLADEILVLNVGGYVGESTRSEIAYARTLGKAVRWLEPENAI